MAYVCMAYVLVGRQMFFMSFVKSGSFVICTRAIWGNVPPSFCVKKIFFIFLTSLNSVAVSFVIIIRPVYTVLYFSKSEYLMLSSYRRIHARFAINHSRFNKTASHLNPTLAIYGQTIFSTILIKAIEGSPQLGFSLTTNTCIIQIKKNINNTNCTASMSIVFGPSLLIY